MQENRFIHRTSVVVTSLATAGMLSACMSPAINPHGGREDLQSAEYVALVTDRAVAEPLVSDCRIQRDALSAGSDSFALITKSNYEGKFVRTHRYWIVAVDRQEKFRSGEVVYFNSRDCQVPLASTNHTAHS